MERLFVLVILLLTFSLEAKSLDLHEAIHIALENNLELKFAKFDETLRLHQLKILRQKFNPQLFFNASATIHHETYFQENFDEKKIHTYPSVKMMTPYGTQLEIFTEQNVGFERYQKSSGTALRISIEQPLLQGRRKLVNTWEINNAIILNDIQQLLFQQTQEQVIYQVIVDFRALQLCSENVTLQEHWLKNAKQFYQNMQEKVVAGRVAVNDLNAALLQVKQAEINLNQAQFEQTQAKRRLIENLHLTDESITFKLDEPKMSESRWSLPKVIDEVIANDIEGKVLTLNKERVAHQLVIAKDQNLPHLKLRGDWTVGRYHIYGEKADEFSDETVFGYPFVHDNGNYTAQMLLNIPLSDKQQRYHRILAARSEIEKLEYESQHHHLRMKNFATSLLEQIQVKKRQLQLAQESLKLAQKNYNDTLLKLEVGRSSLFEMVNQQERLLRAQMAKNANQIAYYNSVANLELNAGRLAKNWLGTA
ncbi:TolC family protein [Candidatus Berkiella aquae]|uniref:Outer membrane efflux protein n=1 Tax=Candidatus Berkiella aquae TaxID=295108 RepID=A0A0Q9Z0F7_9GAMM|nr:TolC family protein [Candidatus Berkiella aquae]MCS5712116.1 TolC family protein [Candidatus Berkiella aquae]